MFDPFPGTAPPLRALATIALIMSLACNDSPTRTAGEDDPVDPPTITEIQPVGAGAGASVTLTGEHFGEDRAAGLVRVSGTEATIGSWADTRIVFVMPAGFDDTLVSIELETEGHTVEAGTMMSWEPGVIQLTRSTSPTGAGEPAWSPDGAWIYYTERIDGQYDIFRIPSTGGSSERLTNTPHDENWPDVNFGSGEIAFGSNTTAAGNLDGDYEIWIATSDFATATHIDPLIATQTYLDRTPAWSRSVAGGIVLAYSSENEAGDLIINLHDAAGGVFELTAGFNPRFDPRHGDRIVFVEFESQSFVIYRTTTTPGAERTPLSTEPETGGSADWGVNDKIVYERIDGFRDIWMMDSDGANQIPLIATGNSEYGPRWSPNADRVVFGSHRSGEINIFVYTLQARREGR